MGLISRVSSRTYRMSKRNIKHEHSTTNSSKRIKTETSPNPTCQICQNEITNSTSIARPSSCPTHIFCVDCLLHWTKNSSCFCPFDRISYDKVYIYTSYSQRFKKPSKILTVDKTGTKAADPKFIVSTGSLNIEEDEDQMNYAQFLENIVCKMCGASDRDDELLLCDGCDEAI